MLRKALVLVVEDEAVTALAFRRALEEAGYGVLGPVPSYERAIELVGLTRPDLAILDVNLAGVRNGADLARALMQRHIPALFISSSPSDALDHKDCAVGLLTKPVSEDVLLATVELVLTMADGKSPSEFPVGFERFDWRPGNGKNVSD